MMMVVTQPRERGGREGEKERGGLEIFRIKITERLFLFSIRNTYRLKKLRKIYISLELYTCIATLCVLPARHFDPYTRRRRRERGGGGGGGEERELPPSVGQWMTR